MRPLIHQASFKLYLLDVGSTGPLFEFEEEKLWKLRGRSWLFYEKGILRKWKWLAAKIFGYITLLLSRLTQIRGRALPCKFPRWLFICFGTKSNRNSGYLRKLVHNYHPRWKSYLTLYKFPENRSVQNKKKLFFLNGRWKKVQL